MNCKSKRKIFRKPAGISSNLLIQALRGNLVQLGQILVQNDLLPTNEVNPGFKADEF